LIYKPLAVLRSEDPEQGHAPFYIIHGDAIVVAGIRTLDEATSICFDINRALNPAEKVFLPAKRGQGDFQKYPEKGQAILEMALAIPFVLALLLGGADLLWLENCKGNVDYLAREAAVCTTKQGCDPTGFALNAARGLSLDPTQLTVTVSGTSVTLVYQCAPLVPAFPVMTIHSTAVAP
jgi:hypothetical protein